MKRVALYPGSFDPFTLGHLDIVQRLSPLYDEVVVAVMSNPNKTPYLSEALRVRSIEQSVSHLPNVRVLSGVRATVDAARQVGARTMIRGLRSVTDFEYESTLAAGYRYMAPEIETLFLLAKPEHGDIRSSLVREIHALGGDVSALVPAPVLSALAQKTPRKENEK
ncbi:MAG: pantetheine-phosphate adenylyltransferase [Candidatus Spyradocola sp.]